MMTRKELDLWVGVFVVIGMAALLFLSLKVANLTSFSAAEAYTVKADFDNIGGLKVRAPVKSAGVVVGRVAEIRFDNEVFKAQVTLNVDSRFQFPKDSSASILTSGLLGEQYVPFTDTEIAYAGKKFKPIVLEDLISQFLYSKAADGGDKK